MFGIGMPEMLMILAVALIIIGPKKLPELAKTLGRALGDFKRATNDLKDSIEAETGVSDVRDNLSGVKQELEASVSLDDEAPVPTAKSEAKYEDPEEPMTQVKEAFDEMNSESDQQDPTDDEDDDDDEMGADLEPEDKATP